MKVTVYNKLVRDKIPDEIHRTGGTCITETLSDERYIQELNKKLAEEVAEYQKSGSLQELADIVDVVYAIAEVKGASAGQFNNIRAFKSVRRGLFKDKIFLVSTTYPDDGGYKHD